MWNIQVHALEGPQDIVDESVSEGNVLERAMALSKEHMGHVVTVWGFARMRYRIKDGKVEINQSNYDHYYTIENDDDMASALIFSECIIHDNEGTVEEELKKLGADEMRKRIVDVICPEETRKNPEMFEIWYRARVGRFYFY